MLTEFRGIPFNPTDPTRTGYFKLIFDHGRRVVFIKTPGRVRFERGVLEPA